MDTGFLILIPLVFLSIAYNVYLHYQRIRTNHAEDLFLSLHYLLNRQTHEAVDVFKKRVTDTGYNFETYLALGNLYRHEGKLDEAIHVHETIITQKILKRSFRSRALYELATDYLQAGILDKAEHIFMEISAIDSYRTSSRRALLDIYQQLSDWPRAIDIASLLAKDDSKMWSLIIHFYCEMIDDAIEANAYPTALAYIQSAQTVDQHHPRLLLAKIRYYMALGCYRLAIEAIEAVCDLEPSYVLLTYQWLYDCCSYQQVAFIDSIVPLLEKGRSAYTTIQVSQFLLQHMEAGVIFDQVLKPVLSQQTLPECLTNSLHSQTMGYRDLLSVLSLSMGNRPPYICHGCGFNSATFYWKCPGCQTWGEKLADC